MTDLSRILAQSRRYYSARLREHGPVARGVDWNSEASQRLRFDQLLRALAPGDGSFSLNDYGCGYGALVGHLEARGLAPGYLGFDIADDMIQVARALHPDRSRCRFTSLEQELESASFTVASGVFNVRLETGVEEWEGYVLATLERLAALSRDAFAFNLLTLDSDPERRQEHLYYADPAFYLEHCRRRFSSCVALLQDYDLYEFTMVVRKVGSCRS